jgi:predicted DNA-binding ribbon-helix-helix protein
LSQGPSDAAQTFQFALPDLCFQSCEQSNLSSAVRLFVLHHFRNEDKRMEVAKAELVAVGAERTPTT